MMNIDREAQVLGVAYNYQISKAMRHSLTKDLSEHHSSKHGHFSYFKKADNLETIALDGEVLRLKEGMEDPIHWHEPEIAIILGEEHEIVGYTLANDLTAANVEMLGRSKDFDGTYYGKKWPGGGSLGPRVIGVDEIDVNAIDIGLRIVRNGEIIYDHSYNTSKRKFKFEKLPMMILDLHAGFGNNLPDSKDIRIEDGYLSKGTVIMTGTGIITSKRFYAQPGDIVTVYCKEIGELKNTVSKS